MTAEDQLRFSEMLSVYRLFVTTYRFYLPGLRSEIKEEFFPVSENEILHCVVEFNYKQEVLDTLPNFLTLDDETHKLCRKVIY
jgi:hypothetical protein